MPFAGYAKIVAEIILETNSLSLVTRVTTEALDDAGIRAEEIDEVFLGHYGGGLAKEQSLSSLPTAAAPELRFKPATRVENAFATGSAAIHQAIRSIESGQARRVLVAGADANSQCQAGGDIQYGRCCRVPLRERA